MIYIDEIKVFYDRIGSSLIIWFDDPQKEAICEEFGEDTVLMKDKDGRVIGVEKMNMKAASMEPILWAFQEQKAGMKNDGNKQRPLRASDGVRHPPPVTGLIKI